MTFFLKATKVLLFVCVAAICFWVGWTLAGHQQQIKEIQDHVEILKQSTLMQIQFDEDVVKMHQSNIEEISKLQDQIEDLQRTCHSKQKGTNL
jgi:hypothetical protein